jgi:hypothetical protein
MNRAQCRNCKEILVSRHVHDLVSCRCYKETIAVVRAYKKDVNTPEYWDFVGRTARGFYLDGGDEYLRYGGKVEDINWECDE